MSRARDDRSAFRRPDATNEKPERSTSTVEAYRRRAEGLLAKIDPEKKMAAPDRLLAAARSFAQAQGTLAAASIRVYRASLRQAAEDLQGVGQLNAERAAEIETLVARGPDPRAPSAPRRTSARKRRSISPAERRILLDHLVSGHGKTPRLLAALVGLSSIIPIRPSEWHRARVVKGHLLIVCAKRSNGRGIARVRRVKLGDEALKVATLRAIAALRAAVATAGSWSRLYARLSRALTRECRKIGIAPICLYTLRHQAIATAKRHFDLDVVAALAGHASILTATHSYAKRRSGWHERPRLHVPDRLVARVRVPKKAMRFAPGPRPGGRL